MNRTSLVLAALLLVPGGVKAQEAHHEGPAAETAEQAAEAARLKKLLADADARTVAKEYKDAASLYESLVKDAAKADLTPADKKALLLHATYDLACCLSAAGEKEAAVKTLALLPRLGYSNWDHVKHDAWFAPLHDLESFQKLTGVKEESRPAPPSTEELFDDGFYRSPRGDLVLPSPPHDGWLFERVGAGSLAYFKGDEKKWSARITLELTKPGSDSGEALARSAAVTMAKACVAANPYLSSKDELAGHAIKAPAGSHAWEVDASGTDPKKGAWTVHSVSVAREALAVNVVIWTNPATDKAACALAGKIVEALRLGDQVPKLEDRKPGTVLEGVYSGPYEVNWQTNEGHLWWVIFDKRGYASWDSSPFAARSVDLEAWLQSGAPLLAYAVKDGKLELTNVRDGKKSVLSFASEKGKLTIDGKEYDRLDGGATAGLKLAGTWESYSSTRSATSTSAITYTSTGTYVFLADGTFKTSESAGVSGYAGATPGNNDYRSTLLASHAANDRGTYEVKADRIVLRYGDGTVKEETFYPEAARPGLKLGIIYIAGESYLKKK